MWLTKSLLSASLLLLIHQSSGAPQRTLQLGSPQPLSLQGPNYSQHINFGGQGGFTPLGFPPHLQHQQHQPSPRPQLIPLSPQRPQAASPTPSPQPQASPTARFTPQTRPVVGSIPFGQFPAQSSIVRGGSTSPILLKSPQQTLQPSTSSSAEEDEGYEYEDEITQPVRTRVPQVQIPQVVRRPAPSPQPQRVQASPAPQRFAIQQQQPQRIRQPVQRIPQQQQQAQSQVPQPQPIRQLSVQSDQRLIPNDQRRGTTPPPVQTVNRFQRTNEDGSMTWGYENEDGTFKEETLGIDCVVRGKYGYVDPDGNKREYEYQAGNPCDPNAKDEEEQELEAEEEEDQPRGGVRPFPGQQGQQRPRQQQQLQQLGGIINARPNAPLNQRRIIQIQQ